MKSIADLVYRFGNRTILAPPPLMLESLVCIKANHDGDAQPVIAPGSVWFVEGEEDQYAAFYMCTIRRGKELSHEYQDVRVPVYNSIEQLLASPTYKKDHWVCLRLADGAPNTNRAADVGMVVARIDQPYRRTIDEAMAVREIGVAKDQPQAELEQIIKFECDIALDPSVSKDARLLIEDAKAEDVLANAATRTNEFLESLADWIVSVPIKNKGRSLATQNQLATADRLRRLAKTLKTLIPS